jgi:hypothetical protein
LIGAALRVCQATIGPPDVVIVSGSGEFLARRVAERVLGPDRPIVSLADRWGREASCAACARALVELAANSQLSL